MQVPGEIPDPPQPSLPNLITPMLRPPVGMKTPEQLAQEYEERVAEQQCRDRRWRRRRIWQLVGALGTGVALPGFLMRFFCATQSMFVAAVILGGLGTLLIFWQKWGMARSMVVFGVISIILTVAASGPINSNIYLILFGPMLACGMVAIGCLIGFIVTYQENDF